MTLFTRLKIILLQYFQFSVFNNKRYSNIPLEELHIIIQIFEHNSMSPFLSWMITLRPTLFYVSNNNNQWIIYTYLTI